MPATELPSMRRCILYYPTISIPTGSWLRRSLLYWDQLGSIVPESYSRARLISYTPELELLRAEGEFRPFNPRRVEHQAWQFSREFEEVAKSEMFQKLLPPKSRRRLLSKIHKDKLSDELFYFLEREGLAKEDQEDYEWYRLESHTALLYMGLLAQYVAERDRGLTVPGTDKPGYERLIFQATSKSEGFPCLRINLLNSLPVPREDVPLSKIVEFKQKRREELLHFRQLIDEVQTKLKNAQAVSEMKHLAITFSERIERGVKDLEAVLNDSLLATVVGSAQALIKLDSPTLWGLMGVGVGKATEIADLPLEWVIPGIITTGSIQVGVHLVSKRNERRAALRASPFAYLYHAKKKLPLRMN